MAATLDFFGGARTVTGSRFLIQAESSRVLVDCGLFQGLRELRRRNWEPFPVDPGSLDAVVVSHAHLDHSGYLPALTREGFAGPIYASAGTAALAAVVLRDSAHLLQEDAQHAKSHGYSKHREPRPLYTDGDVDKTLTLMRTAAFDTEFAVADGVTARLRPGGHILGSSTVRLRLAGAGRTVLFSGDLGRPAHPLLAPPAAPEPADVVVIESTYGNRRHADDEGDHLLADVVTRTVHRGGSVVIPAFAVDRTEVILMALARLRAAGAIPDVPIYVDSPMALAALRIYRHAIHERSPEIRPDLPADHDLFDPGNLHEVTTVAESTGLNAPRWPCVIVSASGMVSGGRVLHHLVGMLPDTSNTVVLAGYQAEGTRGRDLLEGARTVKIHGRYVPVRAEIVDVPTFSVHADAAELVAWLGAMPSPPEVSYIVHGEPEAAFALQSRIRSQLGWNAVVPRLGERVRLD
jgi:metallo-beta-lactamase family protein